MHIVKKKTLKPRALEKINFVPNKRRGVYMRLYGMCIARHQDALETILTSRGQGAGTIWYKAPEMFIAAKQSGYLLIQTATD